MAIDNLVCVPRFGICMVDERNMLALELDVIWGTVNILHNVWQLYRLALFSEQHG